MQTGAAKKIGFWQLIFLTTAFFASIRRIPNLAYVGWEVVPFMLFAVVMFVLPVSFVSAQLATAMPDDGGLTVWISGTLSPKWGFAASFLVWMQMCFGMVTVGAAFAEIVATLLGQTHLLENDVYIGLTVIVLFWLITLLIIKGVPITAISTWGMILGMVVPLLLLLVLGTVSVWRQPGGFSVPPIGQMLPNLGNLETLSGLSGVIFLFAGMEQAANYANRIDRPAQTYPKALLLATLLTALLFTYAGLLTGAILGQEAIELADPAQVFVALFDQFGLKSLVPVIALMIALSCVTELAAWISGPARNMLQSARDGILPAAFAKTNRHDIPVPLLLLQAGIVSVIALAFVFIPGTNGVFNAILSMAVALYAIVYVLILLAGVRYRKQNPAKPGVFQVPGGKAGAFAFTALGLVGMVFIMLTCLIPPATLTGGMRWGYAGAILLGTVLLLMVPLLLYRRGKRAGR